MAIFKCKMCGGNLEVSEDMTVCECEYCMTKQTLPRLDDDKKANLYDRAGHFRRNNEFDKAISVYEKILDEDNTDAEAYWSLVLCKYGIEYVEDPATHKRVPTVNRAQFTSVFADEDYKSAIQYADGVQKAIYDEEARAIDEIQKGILAISEKEEPFDVFICYKETDNNGRRTPDSVLANDLYHQLTQEGYKVFFARITLEDKLGTAYEPYIFAALNSAKVMVVLGTKPEYFNAVWVKNEWSRYLALIKNGGKKILIPAYKDMDPYDLPEEFSHLQAQDMSKLGFIQDLIRGIKKITAKDEPKQVVQERVVVNNTGSANTAALLERAFIFLEDGKWEEADEYCEKVLDLEPKNAEAYLGKLLVSLRLNDRTKLCDLSKPFDDNEQYEKVVRFGTTELKNELNGYIELINNRNEETRKNENYDQALRLCYDSPTIKDLEKAVFLFGTINGWKDADVKLEECSVRLAEMKKKAEADRIEQEIELAKNRKMLLIIGAVLALLVLLAVIYNTTITPMLKYNEAVSLAESGDYEAAVIAFTELGDYKDSIEQVDMCNHLISEIEKENKYNEAMGLLNCGKYEESREIFRSIIEYKDSWAQIENSYNLENEDKYSIAYELFEQGNYESAIEAFEVVVGYKDSSDMLKESKYLYAVSLMEAEHYKEAFHIFNSISPYKESNNNADLCLYKTQAVNLKNAQVGLTIEWGAYEQDNVLSNGRETIEWEVLAKEGERILVVSKYALDCQPFYTLDPYFSVTSWLDYDFLNSAFGYSHKTKIINTEIDHLTDKIFLLSIDEVKAYINYGDRCKPTAYAISRGASVYDGNSAGGKNKGNCWWWLRDCSSDRTRAAAVQGDCSIYENGYKMYTELAIRPAMWIDIS